MTQLIERRQRSPQEIAKELAGVLSRRSHPRAGDRVSEASIQKLIDSYRQEEARRKPGEKLGTSGTILLVLHNELKKLGVTGGIGRFLESDSDDSGLEDVAKATGVLTDRQSEPQLMSRRTALKILLGTVVAVGLGIAGAYRSSSTGNQPDSPEAKGFPEPITGLTKEQIRLIEAMKVGGNPGETEHDEKIQFIKDATLAVVKQQGYALERHVRPDVLIAQMILETGYGRKSELAKYNNFLAISAEQGDPTWQDVPDMKIGSVTYLGSNWRTFESMDDCVKNYIDTVSSPEPERVKEFAAARKHYENLSWYVYDINKYSGNSDTYPESILDIIYRYQLTELVNLVEAPIPQVTTKPTLQPTPEVTQTQESPVKKAIRLHPEEVNEDQRYWNIWEPHGEGWTANWMMVNTKGQQVKYTEIPWDERYRMVERNLNAVELTLEGFNDFVASIKDISPETSQLKNFDKPRLNNADVKYLVAHYTATDSNIDGYKAARSMSGGNRGVSSYAYIDRNSAEYSILTYGRTGNVLGFNGVTRGTEVEARSQEDVTPDQYKKLIMSFIFTMMRDGYIKTTADGYIEKDAPVDEIIDSMIKGHGSFYGLYGDGTHANDHRDFPEVVMVAIREMMKDFMRKERNRLRIPR